MTASSETSHPLIYFLTCSSYIQSQLDETRPSCGQFNLRQHPCISGSYLLKHSPSFGSWQVSTGFLPAERSLFLLSPLLAPSSLYNLWQLTFPSDSVLGPLLYQHSPLKVILSSPKTFTAIYVPMAPIFLAHTSLVSASLTYPGFPQTPQV